MASAKPPLPMKKTCQASIRSKMYDIYPVQTLTKPSPGPPPGLTHVGAQASPTPSAPRNAEGAALRARVPPMHYADKPNPAIPEGSRLDAKRRSEESRVGKEC